MRARSALPFALLVLLVLPSAAAATDNAWPLSAAPSNYFGWNVVGSWSGADGIDAQADGSGGYFVAADNGDSVRVQRVLANGRFAWSSGGLTLGGRTNSFGWPAMAADGLGGVLVAAEWHDGGQEELVVCRVNANGTLPSGWPASGVPVSPSADYDYYSDVVSDGEGGALVSFIRSGPYRVRVSHVLANGTRDPNWPSDGVEVQQSGPTYVRPRIFMDGQGGALVAYREDSGKLWITRVDRHGQLHPDEFPGNGISLSTGVDAAFDGVRTEDGVVAVVWTDARTGSREVYVDLVMWDGRWAGLPQGGVPLSSTPGVDESVPAVTSDASRDLVFAWKSGSTIVGLRRQQDLSAHDTFPYGGAVVCPSIGSLYSVSVDSDGAGGLLAGWIDSGLQMFRAQRLTPSGAPATHWPASGHVLASSAPGYYYFGKARIFHDGDRGIVGVLDEYMQLVTNRLRRDGTRGLLASPVLQALADVPNDQGGRLALYWRASENDTLPANPVGSYAVWRRMPGFLSAAGDPGRARTLAEGESPGAIGAGAVRAVASGTTTTYWEYLGSTPARGWSGYGMTVSTNSDLLGPSFGFPWEVFMVEAVGPGGAVLGASEPDSAFSLDNLSPSMPVAFTAVRAGGATHLHWLPNSESDFRDYRLHRGASASFVPSDANQVGATSDTGWVDAAPAACFYKLIAYDVHGNPSPVALVTPAQTVDAPGAGAGALAFAPIAPNPARGHATLSFTLPAGGRVRLAVFDAQGRLARTLVDSPLAAGAHSNTWDLRDARGQALSPGLYLARLETPSGARVRRLAIME